MSGSIHLRDDVKHPYWEIFWYEKGAHGQRGKQHKISSYYGTGERMFQMHPHPNGMNLSRKGEGKMYWKYLKYVLRHKWYVSIECFKMGLFWRGITHDLSKFRPSEFIPYARFFYGNGNNIKSRRDKTGYYKPYDTGDQNFDFAWLLHQKRNRHHWQWWVLPQDDGAQKVMRMGFTDIREMIADWIGAGMAISGRKDPRPWYQANKDKMQLHPDTREAIETILDSLHLTLKAVA